MGQQQQTVPVMTPAQHEAQKALVVAAETRERPDHNIYPWHKKPRT